MSRTIIGERTGGSVPRRRIYRTLAGAAAVLLVSLASSGAARNQPPATPPGYPPLPAASNAFTKAADWQDEIIYFVLLDRFANGRTDNDLPGQTDRSKPTYYHGGDLAGLTKRLDYIKSLGATAIWITPLYKQVGKVGDSYGYHGYWFEDPTAIDPQFGTPDEFREMIRQAHARGLKVILDLVVNHSGYNASITRTHPAWFHTEEDRTRPGAIGEEINSLAGLPDFKQENPETAAYLKRTVKHWLNEYDLDGLRLDTVKHVPHFFWRELIAEVDGGNGMKDGRRRDDVFWVGEALIPNLRKEVGDYQASGFESMFDFPLRSDLVATFGKGGSVDRLAEGLTYDRYYPAPHRMTTLLDNHDVPRFVNEPGFGVPEDEIRARQLLAFDFIFTQRGIPQIYYGNEIGMYGGGDPDNRRDMPEWAFDKAARNAVTTQSGFIPFPRRTWDHLNRLCQLRRNNPALYRGFYYPLWKQGGSGRNVLAYLRSDPATGNRFLVALNNDKQRFGHFPIPLTALPPAERAALSDGRVLDDLFGEPPITITDGQWHVYAAPLTSRILRPRAPGRDTCQVTFAVTPRSPVPANDTLYVLGDLPELGGWDPTRAIRLQRPAAAGQPWTVPLRYLKRGQNIRFRIVRLDHWKVAASGPIRAWTVPNTPAATVRETWK
jgi:alpha-amylase